MSNFDRIAPVYDKLVGAMFGSAVRRAQILFLSEIGPHSKVLMLGGGTGWLLAELLSLKPGCKVTYIDASEKMIDTSKKRFGNSRNVIFIHGTEKQIPVGSSYDAVITHFYLDLFTKRSCREVCNLIRSHCNTDTVWIACDFVVKTWWHRLLLRVMYTFFRWATGLRTDSLPDWRECIYNTGFRELGVRYYYGNFIASTLYRLDATRKA